MSEQAKSTVFITGAASGIGRCVALNFARRGANLGLTDRNVSALETVAEECRALGAEAVVSGLDVTSSEQIKEAVARTVARFGGLSTTVAAAGVAIKGDIAESAEDSWYTNIAVNLNGVYLTAHHTLPHLVAHGKASFIALSSDAGIRGSSGYGAYCAAKHGVVGLIRCLALDYGPKGVRSNAICPHFVDTPMARGLLEGASKLDRAFYERRIPLGRFAQPEEVADAVAHLASDEARYINGTCYVIDGGATAGTFGGA